MGERKADYDGVTVDLVSDSDDDDDLLIASGANDGGVTTAGAGKTSENSHTGGGGLDPRKRCEVRGHEGGDGGDVSEHLVASTVSLGASVAGSNKKRSASTPHNGAASADAATAPDSTAHKPRARKKMRLQRSQSRARKREREREREGGSAAATSSAPPKAHSTTKVVPPTSAAAYTAPRYTPLSREHAEKRVRECIAETYVQDIFVKANKSNRMRDYVVAQRRPRLQTVPLSFKDKHHYISVFRPLAECEIRDSILNLASQMSHRIQNQLLPVHLENVRRPKARAASVASAAARPEPVETVTVLFRELSREDVMDRLDGDSHTLDDKYRGDGKKFQERGPPQIPRGSVLVLSSLRGDFGRGRQQQTGTRRIFGLGVVKHVQRRRKAKGLTVLEITLPASLARDCVGQAKGSLAGWLLSNASTDYRRYAAICASPSYPIFQHVLSGAPKDPRQQTGVAAASTGPSVGDAMAGSPTVSESDANVSLTELRKREPRIITNEPHKQPHFLHPGQTLGKWVRSRDQFNSRQSCAIVSCVAQEGITLIQGPPGTGKSHTLLGLMNMLHVHFFSTYQRKLMTTLCFNLQRLGIVGLNKPTDFWSGWLATIFEKVAEPPKFIITAPSNMAVDRICSQCRHGSFLNEDLHAYTPKFVRMGHTEQPDVQDMLLSKKVEDFERRSAWASRKIQNLEDERSRCYHAFDRVLKKLIVCLVRQRLSIDSMQVRQQLLEFMQIFSRLRDRSQLLRKYRCCLSFANRRDQGKMRRDLEYLMLEESGFVATTLSSSGLPQLRRFTFNVCIIDEAGQAVEAETLIPMQYGCTHVVLCGDPNQLPATVMSRTATKHRYHMSMFERLALAGKPLHFLNVQYRSHPDIYSFSSDAFYRGMVENGHGLRVNRTAPHHQFPALGPLVFFDLRARQQRDVLTRSYSNHVEAEFITWLLQNFGQKWRLHSSFVGLLTPYLEQRNLLRRSIARVLRPARAEYAEKLEAEWARSVRTVDAFQGQERSIIIYSTVRDDSKGFVKDPQRMCVALTRARRSLWIVGNAGKLWLSSPLWRDLLTRLGKERRIFQIPASDSFNLFSAETPPPIVFTDQSRSRSTSPTGDPAQ